MIWLTIIKSLLSLAPLVIQMVRDGRIREGARNETIAAFEAEFMAKHQERVDRAATARNAVDDSVPDTDPNDRASRRKS